MCATVSRTSCFRLFMVGFGLCPCPRTVAGASFYSSGVSSSATTSRRIKFHGLETGGSDHERQKQLLSDCLANTSEWRGNRLKRRSCLYPEDFRHKKTRGRLWLHSPCKAMRIDSRLATPVAQLPSGQGRAQGLGHSSPGSGELQRLCEQGQVDKALDVLVGMDTVPAVSMYSSLLKACVRRKALAQAKRVQSHMAQHGLECTRFLGEYMVSTLVKCGALEDALQLFRKLQQRTVFSWTALISGHTVAGRSREAIRMYQFMREEGLEPNRDRQETPCNFMNR